MNSLAHALLKSLKVLTSHSGLFSHAIVTRYTGMPTTVNATPIAISRGLFTHGHVISRVQMMKKMMGKTMLTLMGRLRVAFVRRMYNKPATLMVMNRASTNDTKLMRTYTSSVIRRANVIRH